MDALQVINDAVKVLREGGVILYPTDTVWGIGCDATDEKAVARVFEIKKRPEAKSLVLLASDLDMVARYVKAVPSIAVDLVEVNDAPMTIIYPEAQYIAPNAVAADGSVGIRIPCVPEEDEEENGRRKAPQTDLTAGSFCRELVRRLRKPLVSTSANISGEPAPGGFDDIAEEIRSAVDFVVPRRFGQGACGRASQIIKVGLGGEVEIIRA